MMVVKYIAGIIMAAMLYQSEGFSQENSWQYFGGATSGLDITFINDKRVDQDEIDLFYYFTGHFYTVGLEAGMYNSKSVASLLFTYGFNPNPEVEQRFFNYNGDLDLLDALSLGLLFRRYTRDPKLGKNITFQTGLRAGAFYQHYWGYRIFDEDQNLFIKERYSMSLFGVEVGYFLEFGKSMKKGKTIILNLEPVYYRKTNEGFAIGIAKTSIQLRF